ncbi:filamentous hemagglutinin N-terminal domain-containing protein [Erwinia sp. S43]|uniref:two-partner secretion domain-containing protein n=1 Tax=unclassified Erwinia TaxID=2622719 RepID=UPI00190B5F0E|nr:MULTISPECIES: filamentous hemagglutinin N-terminal domain-containing protein [unclassified Erwinia]MBK0032469.1 filamentous hemagglutinin N-terminal domain-containing protein [Erwinia sp. S43]MCW1873608.1 filamentous hemagglutinin N-terminal domain-containing protein [Erwinia sp. INIA01]
MINGKSSNLFKASTICMMTWLAMGYITTAQAAVVVDIKQAERPWVKANTNGSVTVNINSASSAGVSHNKYTQFDVTKQGLVLNNSKAAINSQLAGQIAGNTNLSAGEAKLIINEVTSNIASQLNGQIEVAGKKADVIVANPSGITCSGCGFINTGRGTLTTGTPTIGNDGSLTGINVQKGKIIINGQGMTDTADYTTLLAAALQVNAKIDAKEIQVMSGINSNIVTSGNQLVNTGYTKNAPAVGIDVSALGGMYADKITLMAASTLDGVRNKGIISANSDLNINLDGTITNIAGTLESKTGSVSLSGKRLNNTTGKIFAGKDIDILSEDTLTNSKGLINAEKMVAINGTNVNNDRGFITGNEVSIVSGTLTNTNSKLFSDNPKAVSEGGIYAEKDVSVNTNGLLNTSAGWIYSDSGNVSLVSNTDMVLNYSRIYANKDILVSSKTVDYPARPKPDPIDAHLVAGNDINFVVGNLGKFDGTTVLDAGHDINISSLDGRNTGTFLNYATLSASNNINYDHGIINNYGVLDAGNEISIKTNQLINHAVINGYGNVKVDASQSIYNDLNGMISSMKNLTLSGPTINNYRGRLIGKKGIDVYTNKYTNTGYTSGTLNQNPLN